MAEKLTPQQKMAVSNRGGKLLVSAAAGSGKTKVLVDRLLSYLTDPVDPANIDEFLIITYTKAAASELRAKIAAKLTDRIASEPGNRHLQQQMQRLYLTKISTVHAFCGDILREYAYRLDLPADYRVADEGEAQDLQQRVLERLLDKAYDNAGSDPDFCAFIDSQGFGRDDRQIPQILQQVYNSARCHLDPEKWLNDCLISCQVADLSDASQTPWGAYLIQDFHSFAELQIQALEACMKRAVLAEGFEKPAALLSETCAQLRSLLASQTWDAVRTHSDIDFGRLTFPKNCTDLMLKSQIKAVRDACKAGIAKKRKAFADPSQQVLQDIAGNAPAIRGLIALVRQFTRDYAQCKQGRRVLDFGDLEHKMLDLVLGKSRSGPTAAASEIGARYREIMVDEYQDTNGVQDAIFSALTQQRQNCFMVGDVKQSIYQFRLADPGIFLEKYHSFAPAGETAPGQGRKVLLSSNFRSSAGVISAVNDVFTACMSEKVGGLIYGEDEMLREGIPHIPLKEPETELYAIQVDSDTYAEEAAFVARRVCELLDGKHMVREGESLRPVQPADIVILLRSPNSVGVEFRLALEARGIPCCIAGTGVDLMQTEEISELYALLQVISNPLQDIPLVAALSGRTFGFTSDELAALRGSNRRCSVLESVTDSDSEKCKDFLQALKQLRKEAQLSTLTRFLDQVLAQTRLDSIYAAMPNGQERTANIQAFCQLAADYEALGCRDLERFLERMEAARQRGASITSDQETAGAVTIMSIHKSKGLEFPVVFICGLSRGFNQESARSQVLCHKELGLGLACVDAVQRVRYPTAAKRAIAAKILEEGLSEEMRVLYVAMTRAKDRLIMTYASATLEKDISDLTMRMDICDPQCLTLGADCPGTWILLTALQRTEAAALFALGGKPEKVSFREPMWKIQVVQGEAGESIVSGETSPMEDFCPEWIYRIRQGLAWKYPHTVAVSIPSKQTVTQLKGREKDMEAAENTVRHRVTENWRQPVFTGSVLRGTDYGNAVHAVMQYIRYDACDCEDGVRRELARLSENGCITTEQAQAVNCSQIAAFFASKLGQKLRKTPEVLREFKFSILQDASKYYPDAQGEKILLQGVVDCALVDEDGITVIDFKTDGVTPETIDIAAQRYSSQVQTYADALARIYEKPVKECYLYFFSTNEFVKM